MIQPIKQAMSTAQNPQMVLETMMRNNPQLRQVSQIVQQYNGDAKAAFYALAQRNGVDPNDVLNMLK